MISLHLPKGFSQTFFACTVSALTIFLAFEIFRIGQKDQANWYQLVFAWASLVMYIKFFVYTFGIILNLINTNKSAILIVFNILLTAGSSFFGLYTILSLPTTSYPDRILFGILAATACFLIQVLINQDKQRSRLVIIVTVIYLFFWVMIQFRLGIDYLIVNPRLNIFYFQAISVIVLAAELFQLLSVTRRLRQLLPEDKPKLEI